MSKKAEMTQTIFLVGWIGSTILFVMGGEWFFALAILLSAAGFIINRRHTK